MTASYPLCLLVIDRASQPKQILLPSCNVTTVVSSRRRREYDLLVFIKISAWCGPTEKAASSMHGRGRCQGIQSRGFAHTAGVASSTRVSWKSRKLLSPARICRDRRNSRCMGNACSGLEFGVGAVHHHSDRAISTDGRIPVAEFSEFISLGTHTSRKLRVQYRVKRDRLQLLEEQGSPGASTIGVLQPAE